MKRWRFRTSVFASCAVFAGCASAPVSSTESAPGVSSASDAAPRAEHPTTTRLPSGLLKLSDEATTRYLKPNCDPSDKSIVHCNSYQVVDENAKPVVMPTPDGVTPPSSTCPQNGVNYYCIGANDLAQAYAIPTYLPSSSTIAIFGFADSPNFESDMNTYRAAYGLPACTSTSGCFRKVDQNGGSSLPAVSASNPWNAEQTLDLEMASAGCPTCKIVLIESTAGLPGGMMTALQTAHSLGASVFSFSGGQGEWPAETSEDNPMYNIVVGDKMAVFASSGDNGAEDTTGELLWPAVNPWVNAVGGTYLTQTAGAKFTLPGYWGTQVRGFLEDAWVVSDPSSWGGAGWGCSAYEQTPFWQSGGVPCSTRAVSDISAVAGDVWDFYTPPPNAEGQSASGSWVIVWGTSIAAPLSAAIYAQMGQPQAASGLGSGFAYVPPGDGVPEFMDITSNGGTTGTCPSSDAKNLCNAQPGWDGPSGLGTPFALNLGPQTYASSTANDRFWHDASGNVLHQNSAGNVAQVLTAATASYGASSAVATYSYPVSGETAWYLDTLSPPHLRQTYVPTSGMATQSDWGTAPSGCTWMGSPAATSWGEARGDLFVRASCSGATHLFHRTWFNAMYSWTDITPPGVAIKNSPAVSSTPGVLDVVVLNTSNQIVHGSCFGACTTGGFTWDAPSAAMSGWASDPALTSPTPGTLFAFDVSQTGSLVYSKWSWASPVWSPAATWYAPATACQAQPAPALARSAQNNLFVGCVAANGTLYGGWGDTAQSGTWWSLASGVVGGAGFSTN